MKDEKRWTSHRKYLYLLAKVILLGIVIALAWFVFELIGNLLINIGISFLIAYLLDPVVNWMEKRGVNRTVSIFILMVIGLGALTGAFFIFTPTIAEEFSVLAEETIPAVIDSARENYGTASGWLEARTGYGLPQTFNETFTNYGQKLQDVATDVVQRVTSVSGEVLSASWAVIAYLVNILMIPLFVFYYLRDFDKMKAFLADLLPLPVRDRVLNKARRVDTVVGDWFRGQLTVSLILGVLYSVGLVILDVKLGIVIGLVAGLLHIIPYLGFVVGIALALVMSAIDDGSGWGQFFGVIISFTCIQTLEAYIITPKIVGDRVGLSPLMVIIVMLIGGTVFGFWGVLLAVPVAGVLRVFLLDAIADYKRSQFFLGEENFIRLLAHGPGDADESVRAALKQAAEADLDMELPEPLTHEEIHRLSVAIMAGAAHPSDADAFDIGHLPSAKRLRHLEGHAEVEYSGELDVDAEASIPDLEIGPPASVTPGPERDSKPPS